MSTALLVIDVTGSFLPGGELPVPDALAIIPVIAAASKLPEISYVVATRDVHDPHHSSFQAQHGPWPPHGILGTSGSQLHQDIDQIADFIINKGTQINKDGYSGFANTYLEALLDGLGVETIVLAGLATDVCVLNTGLDALSLKKFEVIVLTDAIRAVNLSPGDGDLALETLSKEGATLTTLAELNSHLRPGRSLS